MVQQKLLARNKNMMLYPFYMTKIIYLCLYCLWKCGRLSKIRVTVHPTYGVCLIAPGGAIGLKYISLACSCKFFFIQIVIFRWFKICTTKWWKKCRKSFYCGHILRGRCMCMCIKKIVFTFNVTDTILKRVQRLNFFERMNEWTSLWNKYFCPLFSSCTIWILSICNFIHRHKSREWVVIMCVVFLCYLISFFYIILFTGGTH
jgi:hypothetical protein